MLRRGVYPLSSRMRKVICYRYLPFSLFPVVGLQPFLVTWESYRKSASKDRHVRFKWTNHFVEEIIPVCFVKCRPPILLRLSKTPASSQLQLLYPLQSLCYPDFTVHNLRLKKFKESLRCPRVTSLTSHSRVLMHLVDFRASLCTGLTVIVASHRSRSTTGVPRTVVLLLTSLSFFLFLLEGSGGRGYSFAAYSDTIGARMGSAEISSAVGSGTRALFSTRVEKEVS